MHLMGNLIGTTLPGHCAIVHVVQNIVKIFLGQTLKAKECMGLYFVASFEKLLKIFTAGR